MFFLSPVLTLVSPTFWKGLREKGIGTGTLYILYLTVIITVAAGVFLYRIPTRDVVGFVSPFSKMLPEKVSWTGDRLEVNDNRPFELKFGNSVFGMIDTSVEDISPDRLNGYFVYITSSYAYLKDDKGVYRMIPLASNDTKSGISKIDIIVQNTGEPLPALSIKTVSEEEARSLSFTPKDTEALIAKMWKYLLAFFLAAAFFFIFVWKFFAALFYSLIAMVANAMFKKGASYGNLFCAGAHAMTPLVILQFAGLLYPRLWALTGFWAGTAIVAGYIFLMVRVWEKKSVDYSI